jgi:hypothetical protein
MKSPAKRPPAAPDGGTPYRRNAAGLQDIHDTALGPSEPLVRESRPLMRAPVLAKSPWQG